MYGDGTHCSRGELRLLNGDVDGFMKDHARSEQLCCAGSAKMGGLSGGRNGMVQVLTNDHAS